MSESSDEDIPSADECQKLIESFVELTNTNEALAQFYLQEKWDLATAVNSYFAVEGEKNAIAADSDDIVITFDSGEVVRATTKPPKLFKFLTWNIDGLDDSHLKKRMKAVAKCILSGGYDIVHLQEVTPVVQKYIEEKLPDYEFIAAGKKEYYVATLLKKTSVHIDNKMVHSFPNSVMGRHMLEVEAHIGRTTLHMLNTHLESTADFSNARKTQLRNAFAQMVRGHHHHISILAGDLNLRDKELAEIKIPDGACDLWIQAGMREECKYTWDLTRNTNKSVPGRYQPRCRFDRAYLYQTDRAVDVVHFGLEGILKVEGTQKFPSDHWGLQVHFQVLNNSPTPPEQLPPTEQVSNTPPVSDHREDIEVVMLD